MFGLFDKETPDAGVRLLERGNEAVARYLSLPRAALKEAISKDFEEELRYVSEDQVSFHYRSLPAFSFTIMFLLDEPTLSIFGGEQFRGFMLQRSGDRWFTRVDKPIRAPLGPRAMRLADHLEEHHGVRNLGKQMERVARSLGSTRRERR